MDATIYPENASDQYGNLRKDLANDFLKSANNYRMDLVVAQILLLYFNVAEVNVTRQQTPPTKTELLFAKHARDKAAAAAGNQQPGSGRSDLSEVTCNDCGEKGHYQRSPACPEQKKLKEDAESIAPPKHQVNHRQ